MNPTQIKARSRSSLRMSNFKGSVAAVVAVSSLALLHFNGTDASTTITDVGSQVATWAANGNAQLDTAQQKFGSASLLCDGTGDWVSSTNIGNVLPASGGWTIDCWVRFNSVVPIPEIISYVRTSALVGIRLGHNVSSNNKIWVSLSSNGSSDNITSFSFGTKADFVTNTWYHLALVRDDSAGAYYIYVDGVLDHTITTALQITNTLDVIGLGGLAVNGNNPLNGWIDEFHIASSCLYPGGTTFTPPSAEYSI